MKNSNFKKFDFVKKKENNFDSQKNNNKFVSQKTNNKFVNRRETEEEQLEREYQRRKFREAVLAYDWSKRAPVELKKSEKGSYKSKEKDNIKYNYKVLSNALRSSKLNKKERLDLFKKRILFLKRSNLFKKIKDQKIFDLYTHKIQKLNSATKFLYSRILLVNSKRLLRNKKKHSFFSFFKRLSINDLIKLKEKTHKIKKHLAIQNINLFYYKEIMSFFSFSILKNKILSRKHLNSLFLYINNKFRKKIINKYNKIIFNLKITKKKYISDKLFTFKSFIIYDLLKIYPLSFFIDSNIIFKEISFKKRWNNFYLNRYLLKIFFKKNFSKNKILKFALKKKYNRKIFSHYVPNKFVYFKKKFIFLNKQLSLTKNDENREMTAAEVSRQSSLKNALKKSINKKEMLSGIFKMKYPNLSTFKINKLLNIHIKTEMQLLKKLKKNRKKKLNKLFLKLNNFKKKLYFYNYKTKPLSIKKIKYISLKKTKHLSINKTEFLLNKKLLLKLNRTSKKFNFFKKKSKYFLNLNYTITKKYLEKKGIKFNVYGYKTIKMNKYNIKESRPNIKFKFKKNKTLFLNYIRKKKNYFYFIRQYFNSFFKKYRFLMLRNSKKVKFIYFFLFKNLKKARKFNINTLNILLKRTLSKNVKLNNLNIKKYYRFKNKKYLSFFKKKITLKNKNISILKYFYLNKLKNSYKQLKVETSISSNLTQKSNNLLSHLNSFNNKNYIYSIKKKIFYLKRLSRKILKNKNFNNNINLNMKFINIFLSKYSSENLVGKQQAEKDLYLLRKYDKFRNKRNYLNKLKKKKIKLSFSVPGLLDKNYYNKINSYFISNSSANTNLELFIKKYRYKNIFIQPIVYHPKLFIGELSSYKTKDHIDAYWNLNSLYFKFIGFLIREGKRSKAEKILNNSFFFIKEFISGNPIFFFFQSIYNSQPIFEYIKHKKRYKTITLPRITPYNKRLTLSMRSISNNIRNNEILRKFRKIKFKNNLNTSYLLYNLFVSHFFVKGKVKKDLKDNLENAFSKKHFFRKGNISNQNFKYNKLLKFMSFRKIKGYQF